MLGSPNVLEVLLHCHTSPETHLRQETRAVKEALDYLLDLEMIQRYDRTFTTSEKGKFFIEHLLKVPFPVMHFTIPEKK